MAFDLGALVGGFEGGANSGMDLMAKRRQMQEQARIQQAQRALAQGQINVAGGAPTNVPVPGAMPMPQAAPGGAAPPPTMGAAPPAGPMAAAPPGAGAGGPPQPGAMPGAAGQPQRPQVNPQMLAALMMRRQQQQPPSSPGAPPAAAAPQPTPPAFSGTAAPTGDAFQDSQQTVGRIFQELIKQNPDLKKDPSLLFQAAQQQIELMKGVGSDVRNMMLMQTGAAKLQYQNNALAERTQNHMQESQDRLSRINAQLKIANLNSDTRKFLEKERDATMMSIAADRDATTERGQDMNLEGRREGLDAGNERTEASLDEKGREADNAQATSGYKAKVGSMGDPEGKVAKPALKSRTPTQLPRRAGGAKPGQAPAYKSADDVVSAYKAGKLSREQATQILKQNGWAS